MSFVTIDKISWLQWKIGMLRLRLIKLLAGNDKVAINLRLNEPDRGIIGQPESGSTLFFHNVSVFIDDRQVDLLATMQGCIDDGLVVEDWG